jgi:hypothetical protein
MLESSTRMYRVAWTTAPNASRIISTVLHPTLVTVVWSPSPYKPVALPTNRLARYDVSYARHHDSYVSFLVAVGCQRLLTFSQD